MHNAAFIAKANVAYVHIHIHLLQCTRNGNDVCEQWTVRNRHQPDEDETEPRLIMKRSTRHQRCRLQQRHGQFLNSPEELVLGT